MNKAIESASKKISMILRKASTAMSSLIFTGRAPLSRM